MLKKYTTNSIKTRAKKLKSSQPTKKDGMETNIKKKR